MTTTTTTTTTGALRKQSAQPLTITGHCPLCGPGQTQQFTRAAFRAAWLYECDSCGGSSTRSQIDAAGQRMLTHEAR